MSICMHSDSISTKYQDLEKRSPPHRVVSKEQEWERASYLACGRPFLALPGMCLQEVDGPKLMRFFADSRLAAALLCFLT